jgi:sarcosine oxidase
LMEFDGDEPYACWDPELGLKAALHARGPVVDPADAPYEVERQAVARVLDWVGARFPGVAGGPAAVETCLYTNTPDERFILSRRGRIVVASACNGQGFQFAPETGERLARLALGSEGPSEARM